MEVKPVPAADIARSTEAASSILEYASQAKEQLNEKLVKAAVTEKITDSALGNKIDTKA